MMTSQRVVGTLHAQLLAMDGLLPQRNFTATLALRVESQPKKCIFIYYLNDLSLFSMYLDLLMIWYDAIYVLEKKEPTRSLFMFFLMLFFNDYF